MNEEFITEAITNDRYLKAVRLVEQFENEIDRELQNFMKETVELRPNLFVDGAVPSKRQSSMRTEPLAHRRIQADMDRVNRDGDNLKFYISVEWTQPEIHGEEADGALCIVQYKIKNSTRAAYERVKQQTKSEPKWDIIGYSDSVWSDGLGIFYISVTNARKLKNGLQTLREHFFSFHEVFGSGDSN